MLSTEPRLAIAIWHRRPSGLLSRPDIGITANRLSQCHLLTPKSPSAWLTKPQNAPCCLCARSWWSVPLQLFRCSHASGPSVLRASASLHPRTSCQTGLLDLQEIIPYAISRPFQWATKREGTCRVISVQEAVSRPSRRVPEPVMTAIIHPLIVGHRNFHGRPLSRSTRSPLRTRRCERTFCLCAPEMRSRISTNTSMRAAMTGMS